MSSFKYACAASRPSTDRWHGRLGHPSFVIVKKVLSRHQLPCASESSSVEVCDACQCAKSHQLPFRVSSIVSKAPLELVFSDVWGPSGRFSYYVNFIDDYSNLLGPIFLSISPKFFRNFMIFRLMLNVYLIIRSLHCKLIRLVNATN